MNTIENFMSTHSENAVIYRYLDMLAERTIWQEQRIELNEINKLRLENTQLRKQLSTHTKPSIEKLIVFLPIFYRHFWNTVSPNELATLAGLLNAPLIPSPYPEPSAEIISAMKNQFLLLPSNEQEKLIQFCQQLPYKLKVRPEMRTILEKLQ
jgi:hypothetical protein